MKLYLKELIAVTTPSENIVTLDALRTAYGNPKRDDGGSYYDVGEEVVQYLPRNVTADAVREGQTNA